MSGIASQSSVRNAFPVYFKESKTSLSRYFTVRLLGRCVRQWVTTCIQDCWGVSPHATTHSSHSASAIPLSTATTSTSRLTSTRLLAPESPGIQRRDLASVWQQSESSKSSVDDLSSQLMMLSFRERKCWKKQTGDRSMIDWELFWRPKTLMQLTGDLA